MAKESRKKISKEEVESGMPGGGKGRRDEIGRTGVYPVSNPEGASPNAKIQPQPSFGQGERGAEGYEDSGESELFYYPEEIAGSEKTSSGEKAKAKKSGASSQSKKKS
jgi:hypothetical protein